MIEIKVAMKCYNIQAQNHLEHLAEGSSVQNTSLWVILQRKAMFGCVITMERVVVQNVGSAESIYSRSIPFCHQERPRCGRQVVLAPLQWGIKDNESRHLIGELDPALWCVAHSIGVGANCKIAAGHRRRSFPSQSLLPYLRQTCAPAKQM